MSSNYIYKVRRDSERSAAKAATKKRARQIKTPARAAAHTVRANGRAGKDEIPAAFVRELAALVIAHGFPAVERVLTEIRARVERTIADV